MTMPSQIEVVRRHVTDALAHGGTPFVGGLDSIRPPFVDPIVLLDTDESSAAVREETFGPTLTVRTVPDVDEAIRLANATELRAGLDGVLPAQRPRDRAAAAGRRDVDQRAARVRRDSDAAVRRRR